MKLQKIKRIFFNWLKTKGAYEAYKQARHDMNHSSDSTHSYFRSTLNDPSRFISDAFTWRVTPQGHRFWEKLSINWKEYLSKLKADPRY